MDKEKELPISRILLTSLLTPPEERAEYILSLPIQTRRYVLKQLKEVEKGNILPVAWSILAEPEVSNRYKRELRRLLEQRLPREVVEQYQKLYAQPPRALIVTPAEALRYGALQALSFGFYQPPEAILAEIQRQKHTPAYSIGNIAGNLISFGLLATPVGWATKALGISKLVAQIPTQARRAYVVARLAQHMAQSGTVFGIHEALNQMGRNLHEKGYITIDDWNSILRNVAEGMAFGLTGAPTFAKVPKYVKLLTPALGAGTVAGTFTYFSTPGDHRQKLQSALTSAAFLTALQLGFMGVHKIQNIRLRNQFRKIAANYLERRLDMLRGNLPEPQKKAFAEGMITATSELAGKTPRITPLLLMSHERVLREVFPGDIADLSKVSTQYARALGRRLAIIAHAYGTGKIKEPKLHQLIARIRERMGYVPSLPEGKPKRLPEARPTGKPVVTPPPPGEPIAAPAPKETKPPPQRPKALEQLLKLMEEYKKLEKEPPRFRREGTEIINITKERQDEIYFKIRNYFASLLRRVAPDAPEDEILKEAGQLFLTLRGHPSELGTALRASIKRLKSITAPKAPPETPPETKPSPPLKPEEIPTPTSPTPSPETPRTRRVVIWDKAEKEKILKELQEHIKKAPETWEGKKKGMPEFLTFKIGETTVKIKYNKDALKEAYKKLKTLPVATTVGIKPKPSREPPRIAKKPFEKLIPIVDKNNKEVKGYYTDGSLLVKGTPPPKAQYGKTGHSIPLETIQEIIQETQKAPKETPKFLYYTGQTFSGEVSGITRTPIAISSKEFPYAVFKVGDKYVAYSQYKYLHLKEKFPDAQFKVVTQGKYKGLLVALKNNKVMGALAPIRPGENQPLFTTYPIEATLAYRIGYYEPPRESEIYFLVGDAPKKIYKGKYIGKATIPELGEELVLVRTSHGTFYIPKTRVGFRETDTYLLSDVRADIRRWVKKLPERYYKVLYDKIEKLHTISLNLTGVDLKEGRMAAEALLVELSKPQPYLLLGVDVFKARRLARQLLQNFDKLSREEARKLMWKIRETLPMVDVMDIEGWRKLHKAIENENVYHELVSRLLGAKEEPPLPKAPKIEGDDIAMATVLPVTPEKFTEATLHAPTHLERFWRFLRKFWLFGGFPKPLREFGKRVATRIRTRYTWAYGVQKKTWQNVENLLGRKLTPEEIFFLDHMYHFAGSASDQAIREEAHRWLDFISRNPPRGVIDNSQIYKPQVIDKLRELINHPKFPDLVRGAGKVARVAQAMHRRVGLEVDVKQQLEATLRAFLSGTITVPEARALIGRILAALNISRAYAVERALMDKLISIDYRTVTLENLTDEVVRILEQHNIHLTNTSRALLSAELSNFYNKITDQLNIFAEQLRIYPQMGYTPLGVKFMQLRRIWNALTPGKRIEMANDMIRLSALARGRELPQTLFTTPLSLARWIAGQVNYPTFIERLTPEVIKKLKIQAFRTPYLAIPRNEIIRLIEFVSEYINTPETQIAFPYQLMSTRLTQQIITDMRRTGVLRELPQSLAIGYRPRRLYLPYEVETFFMKWLPKELNDPRYVQTVYLANALEKNILHEIIHFFRQFPEKKPLITNKPLPGYLKIKDTDIANDIIFSGRIVGVDLSNDYIHPLGVQWLRTYIEVTNPIRNPVWRALQRMLGAFKMMSFWTPFYVAKLDLWQGYTFAGVVPVEKLDPRVIKLAWQLYSGKHPMTRLLEQEGLFSDLPTIALERTNFVLSELQDYIHDKSLDQLIRLISRNRAVTSRLQEMVSPDITQPARLRRFLALLADTALIPARWVNTITWDFADRFMRCWTVATLRVHGGMPWRKAIQTTRWALGEYGVISPAVLNKSRLFMWIVEYPWLMSRNLLATTIDFFRLFSPSFRQQFTRPEIVRKSLAFLQSWGYLVGLHQLLHHFGFKTQAPFYKYYKQLPTNEELVININMATNVFWRMAYRAFRYDPTAKGILKKRPIQALWGMIQWNIHPIWAYVLELLENKPRFGYKRPYIYPPGASATEKALCAIRYARERLYPITRFIWLENIYFTEPAVLREELLDEAIQGHFKALTYFLNTFVYKRRPTPYRVEMQFRQLLQDAEAWRRRQVREIERLYYQNVISYNEYRDDMEHLEKFYDLWIKRLREWYEKYTKHIE